MTALLSQSSITHQCHQQLKLINCCSQSYSACNVGIPLSVPTCSYAVPSCCNCRSLSVPPSETSVKHQHIIKYSTASHVTQILIISPNCPTCNNVTQVRLKATVPAIYIQQLLRVQHILKKLELNLKKNPWKFEINLKQTAQHLKKMTKL